MGLLIVVIFQILTWMIIIHVVISWITQTGAARISPYHPVVRTLNSIVEPMLAPIRRLVNPRAMGGLDISPMIAIIVLTIIERLLVSVLR